jgi:hypothetical protein
VLSIKPHNGPAGTDARWIARKFTARRLPPRCWIESSVIASTIFEVRFPSIQHQSPTYRVEQ